MELSKLSLSLSDLSPIDPTPEDHCLVVLKSYFDGCGNKDEDRIVIATICGTSSQWDSFKTDWDKVLDKHEADFLHTTDAVALRGDFSSDKGWDDDSVDAFINDCVEVIERHSAEIPYKLGLFPVTLQITIADFLRARAVEPKLPNTVEEICATESLSFCLKWGRAIGAKWYHLYYDQGEPFYGHIDVRMRNRKAKRAIPLLAKVANYGQSNMRIVPAIQAADLFGWCIIHNDDVSRSWHKRLHSLSTSSWQSLALEYKHLLNPRKGVLDLTASWKLPQRAPTKERGVSYPACQNPKKNSHLRPGNVL